MSNSVDPDETAHMSRLIWIYAVCKSLLLSLVAVKELKRNSNLISGAHVFETCTADSECPSHASCRHRWCDGKICLCQESFTPSNDYTACVQGKNYTRFSDYTVVIKIRNIRRPMIIKSYSR